MENYHMILTIFSFIFVIGVLVFFHEMGHFLAAKSVGVRVEKFYLGFNFFGLGLKKMYKGTEYGIGLFPLGGYVKLAGIIDESLDTECTGAPDEFKSKNMFQKIWIMSAGVIMNFVLAIIIFAHLTYHNGIDDPDPRSVVGKVYPEYPADKLGLQKNDEIFSINGIQVADWESMTQEIHSRPKEEIQIRKDNKQNKFFLFLIFINALIKNFPNLSDGQIGKLVGSTKNTVSLIRNKNYWNSSNLSPKDPVVSNLCAQIDIKNAAEKADRKAARKNKMLEKKGQNTESS